MRSLLAIIIIAAATPAFAGPQCTSEPASKWLPKDELAKKIVATEGYKIDVFKVTDGNCYELYGRDKSGKRIEIYYNPINAAVVKSTAR